MKAFIGDIEATVYNGKDLETEAWLICLSEYDSNYNHFFKSIGEAMTFVTRQHETNLFFHNLGGYDGNFITEWLEKKGYSFGGKGEKPTNPDKFVIGGKNNFTIYTQTPKGLMIQNFFDTKKFLKESVESIGKSLGLPKGETPLIKQKRKGKNKIKVTKDHNDYIKRDCKIIKEAMRRYGFMEAYENRIYSIGNFALQQALVGADSFKLNRIEEFEPVNKPLGWKQTYTEKRFKKYFEPSVYARSPQRFDFKYKRGVNHFKEIVSAIKELKSEISLSEGKEKKALEKELEQLNRYREMHGNYIIRLEQNEKGRQSFKGGFIYPNPQKRNKWINQVGMTLDANSLHPYQLATQKLPKDYIDRVPDLKTFNKKYGNGDFLYLADIRRVKAKVKKECVPVVKLREEEQRANIVSGYEGIFADPIESKIDYRTVLAQPDFEYLLENYNIDVLEYSLLVLTVDYELMAKMKKHVDYWTEKKWEAKKNQDYFAYSEAKAMMNNVFGYLGVRKNKTASMARSYICVASFVSAYSRTMTARAVNKIGIDNFCYSAVDSIHMILPKECLTKGKFDKKKTLNHFKQLGIEIDDYKLGAWKIESIWDKAKYIGANCYGEQDIKTGWTTTISGYKRQVAMNDFKIGYKGVHELATKVKGGTLLLPTEFQILGL